MSVLAFKFLLNHVNLSSMDRVMTVFLELHMFNQKLTHLYASPILGNLLWELYFVLQIKNFWDFLVFPYWGFTYAFEVKGESYELLR